MHANEIFSKNLAYYRHKKNFSQQQLANKVSLHRTYISGIEQGKRNPSLKQIDKIAEALGIEPWKMLKPLSNCAHQQDNKVNYYSQSL